MISAYKRFYTHSVQSRLSKIHGMELHEENFDVFSDKITFYYADFSKCILNKDNALDTNGIFYLKEKDSEKINYNICAVAEYAILEFEKYLRTKQDENKNNFKNQLDWLIKNAIIKDDKLYWYYLFDSEEHKAPWASGISQGMGISVLVRGAILFDDENLIQLAGLAANTMMATVEEGGFRYGKGSYEYWYEESVTNSHILNGHIFSILGFYDLYRFTKNEIYYKHFSEGLAAIKMNIRDFDMGYTSKYDAKSDYPANNSYHYLHIILFQVLNIITGDDFFTKYKEKWMRIYKSKFLKTLFTLKMILLTTRKRIIKN